MVNTVVLRTGDEPSKATQANPRVQMDAKSRHCYRCDVSRDDHDRRPKYVTQRRENENDVKGNVEPMVSDACRDVQTFLAVMQRMFSPKPLRRMLKSVQPIVEKISHRQPHEDDSQSSYRTSATWNGKERKHSIPRKFYEHGSHDGAANNLACHDKKTNSPIEKYSRYVDARFRRNQLFKDETKHKNNEERNYAGLKATE